MIIFVIVCAILVFILIRNKIHVDLPSFVHPSLPLLRGIFGVYCFTGKQGSGKTYSVNKFLRKRSKGRKVYSNVTLKDFEYIKLTSLEQLLALRDERECYIVYDEIFTIMSKTSKFDQKYVKQLEEFLTQQRKQGNVFITTAQEWLNLPIEFRRFVRIQVECTTRPLGKMGGILHEMYYDAYNMAWDQMANEYVAPLITQKYSKYEKRYMESYDTLERISGLT